MIRIASPRNQRMSPALVPASLAALLLVASCGRTPITGPAPERVRAEAASVRETRVEAGAPSEVALMLAEGVSVAEFCADYGVSLIENSQGVLRVTPAPGQTCAGQCDAFALDPRVTAAEPNHRVETAETRQESYASDDGFGSPETFLEQPAAEAVNLAAAHRVSLGHGIKVAILDTGVDGSHPLLASRLGAGRDFVDNDATATDERDLADNDFDGRVDEAFGHGTHVAGIVALSAPGALLMPVRVLDADGHGTVAGVAAGLRWAIANGARVINMSLGMLRGSNLIQDLLDDAEERGIIVICSAGNWGAEEPREYPATSSHALAIAASDAFAKPASFTSFGEHVAVTAPGVAIRSAYPGGGYRLWSGTSMSSPFVAGTAALLLSLHPDWGSEELMSRLEETVQPLNGMTLAQEDNLGEGMLDAGAALAPDFRAASGEDRLPEPELNPVLRRP